MRIGRIIPSNHLIHGVGEDYATNLLMQACLAEIIEIQKENLMNSSGQSDPNKLKRGGPTLTNSSGAVWP